MHIAESAFLKDRPQIYIGMLRNTPSPLPPVASHYNIVYVLNAVISNHRHDRYENGTKKMGRMCLTLINVLRNVWVSSVVLSLSLLGDALLYVILPVHADALVSVWRWLAFCLLLIVSLALLPMASLSRLPHGSG